MIKVLIVDDSAVVRKILSREMSQAPDIEVVGTAPDPYVARNKIVALKPDVITLDVEMPRMDGLTFLEKLMQHHPLPVILLSTLSSEGSEVAIRALECGAVDVVCKPSSAATLSRDCEVLVDRIRSASRARCARGRSASSAPRVAAPSSVSLESVSHRLVVIGASTGGTDAIKQVLEQLPATAPPPRYARKCRPPARVPAL